MDSVSRRRHCLHAAQCSEPRTLFPSERVRLIKQNVPRVVSPFDGPTWSQWAVDDTADMPRCRGTLGSTPPFLRRSRAQEHYVIVPHKVAKYMSCTRTFWEPVSGSLNRSLHQRRHTLIRHAHCIMWWQQEPVANYFVHKDPRWEPVPGSLIFHKKTKQGIPWSDANIVSCVDNMHMLQTHKLQNFCKRANLVWLDLWNKYLP